MKRSVLSLFVALIAVVSASAHDFEVDGLYYNIEGTNAIVTYGDFYGYWGDIVIPESVTYNSVTYPVTSIGDRAFFHSDVTSIVIPGTITSIGNCAFMQSESLTEVVIPNSVTSMGGDVFFECINLASVTLPNSITSIEDAFFADCFNLKEVIIPESVSSIGACAFSYCRSLTSVAIPNAVTSIGLQTFMGCRGLKEVTMGNTVTSIGEMAFAECSALTSITIPKTVTRLDPKAFDGCSGLKSITSLIVDPENAEVGCDVFNGVDKTSCTLNVPRKSREIYSILEPWCYFVNILPLPILGPEEISLDSSRLTLLVGESATLAAVVSPAEFADERVTWTSSDAAVATVGADGMVKAVAPGYATITASCGEVSAACAVAVVQETCATPEISINEEGQLVFTCETEGALINANVECQDQHNYNGIASGTRIDLTGRYVVTARATAENKAASPLAQAILVWTKAPAGSCEIEVLDSGTERAVLIQSVGDNIRLNGTVEGEDIALYTLSGRMLYSGKAPGTATTIPVTLNRGEIYLISLSESLYKYRF